MWISGLRAKFIAYCYYGITILPLPNAKLGQGNCVDSGVRTHSYECPPHKVCQVHYICTKKIWYEFEVDERTLSLDT